MLCKAETLLQPDRLHHYSWTTLTAALDCMQQLGGSAWAGDEAQGEGRFDAQHSARGAAQQGLLPDPKEDANRVIEDILAVSACLAGQVLIIMMITLDMCLLCPSIHATVACEHHSDPTSD